MRIQPPYVTKKRLGTAGVVVGVSAAHLLVFAVIARTQPDIPTPSPAPPIEVVLFRLTPPPPPPPPSLAPTPDPGGGKPAAPSRVHLPPRPVLQPELIAPPLPAPEPALVIGAAPVASPTPGMGQGGTGEGTGTGDGDGDGSGSGGTGARLIRGASSAEILSVGPRLPRGVRRPPGRASVNCVIRVDQRLDDCRLVEETPAGFGFGEQALRAAAFFRWNPPLTVAGRPMAGKRVTIFVEIGPLGR